MFCTRLSTASPQVCTHLTRGQPCPQQCALSVGSWTDVVCGRGSLSQDADSSRRPRMVETELPGLPGSGDHLVLLLLRGLRGDAGPPISWKSEKRTLVPSSSARSVGAECLCALCSSDKDPHTGASTGPPSILCGRLPAWGLPTDQRRKQPDSCGGSGCASGQKEDEFNQWWGRQYAAQWGIREASHWASRDVLPSCFLLTTRPWETG